MSTSSLTRHFERSSTVRTVCQFTDRWWYVPALLVAAVPVANGLSYLGLLPQWLFETFAVLVLLPAALLLPVAFYCDALNYRETDTEWKPNPYLYAGSAIVVLLVGSALQIPIAAYYLLRRWTSA